MSILMPLHPGSKIYCPDIGPIYNLNIDLRYEPNIWQMFFFCKIGLILEKDIDPIIIPISRQYRPVIESILT